MFEIGAKLGEGWAVDAVCPKCGNNRSECTCAKNLEPMAPGEHRLVFKKEKRRGKPVTLVGPFALEKSEAAALLKRLKKQLGTGGTVKEEWMEFQGETAEKLRPLLQKEGYGFKK